MLHDHVTYERGVTMMIWGDRLLNAADMGGHEWESAANGTHPAVDMIPRDIIMCDWHYGEQEKYPSVPFFLSRGFKVLPTGWNKVEASNAFIKYAHGLDHPNMMGHLFSTWSGKKDYLEWPPVKEGLKLIKQLDGKAT
jgi:hypothetical protein